MSHDGYSRDTTVYSSTRRIDWLLRVSRTLSYLVWHFLRAYCFAPPSCSFLDDCPAALDRVVGHRAVLGGLARRGSYI